MLLLVVALLFSMEARGEPNPEVRKDFEAWLTPEMCLGSEPEKLFMSHVEATKKWGSLQAEDTFCEVYAEVLGKRTDERHPEAGKLREVLRKVSRAFLEFLQQANGDTVRARQVTRMGARVEWWLSEGYRKDRDPMATNDYTHDDLRALARVYQRSHAHNTDGRDLSGLMKKVLEPALAELKAAEKGMSKEAAFYFRARLAVVMAEYLAVKCDRGE